MVEFALLAVAVWLLRETVPCVWSGAEFLGWGWHPELLCLARAGLFGRASWQLAIVLSGLAAVGLVVSLGRGLWRLARTRWAVRELLRDEVEPSESVRMTAAAAGLERLALVETDRLLCFVHGLRSPEVIISTGLADRLTEGQLQAALLHEAVHVQARDPLRSWAAQLLAGLLVLVPLARNLVAGLRTQLELDADRRAEELAGRSQLAGALHAMVAAGTAEDEPHLVVAGLNTFDARIERLIGGDTSGGRPSPGQIAVSVVSLALLTVVAASAVPLVRRAIETPPGTHAPMQPAE